MIFAANAGRIPVEGFDTGETFDIRANEPRWTSSAMGNEFRALIGH